MALIACRECGKEAAASAEKCPHCGIDYPGSKVAAAGKTMQACGCLLTLLVTIPILLLALCA